MSKVYLNNFELGYTISYEQNHSHAVNFEIIEIAGVLTGSNLKPVYTDNYIEDVTAAPIFAHIKIRWDGCSNFIFDQQKECMLHACCKADLENIGKVLAWCWDLTFTTIRPDWKEYL